MENIETQSSEVKRAEPDSEPFSSPVLRSDSRTVGVVEGPVAERRGAPPASGLPCLLSNNSDKEVVEPLGESVEEVPKINVLTGGHKRTAFVLAEEIMGLANEFGLERLGFFTLTFSDRVQEMKEANRRFNNLNRRVLKARYQRAIVVTERQKSGRVHFHLLVVLPVDIRTGVDFEAFKRGHYQTAGKALRSEWAFWRKTAPLYGFGRHELLPVKSNKEGIACYVGKYVSKNVQQRIAADKGARLVRYIDISDLRPGSGKQILGSRGTMTTRSCGGTSSGRGRNETGCATWRISKSYLGRAGHISYRVSFWRKIWAEITFIRRGRPHCANLTRGVGGRMGFTTLCLQPRLGLLVVCMK